MRVGIVGSRNRDCEVEVRSLPAGRAARGRPSDLPGNEGFQSMSSEETKKILNGTFELVIRTILQKAKSGKGLSASDLKALAELRQGLEEPPKGEEKDWEKEYRRYKALLAKLEYEQQRSRLLPREEVTRAWCNRYTHVKRHLLLWSKRLPGRLVGLDERLMGQALEEEVIFLLSLMGRPGRFTPKINAEGCDGSERGDPGTAEPELQGPESGGR
jgi:hypothetical protein